MIGAQKTILKIMAIYDLKMAKDEGTRRRVLRKYQEKLSVDYLLTLALSLIRGTKN